MAKRAQMKVAKRKYKRRPKTRRDVTISKKEIERLCNAN